jgi:pimeloyl-ACP methyl ester carboxylesterase
MSGATPPLGGYFQVQDRRLHGLRLGSGRPAIVFLPGAGAVALDYLMVQRQVADLSTTVLYDRAGTGWSDAIDLPRSAAAVTDELRELLLTAEVSPPYLFVGHSLGGLYARHYAQRFPRDVAALLLLDPAHEDYDAHVPPRSIELRKAAAPQLAILEKLPGPLLDLLLLVVGRRRYRKLFEQQLVDWPDEIRRLLISRHISPRWLRVGLREAKNVDAVYEEVRRVGPMPDVPLIILSSMGTDDFRRAVSVGESESLLFEEIEGKRQLYTALAGSVPRGEIRPVDSGHFTMHLRRPDVVVQALRDLLNSVRSAR